MYIPFETLPDYSRIWIFPITSDISSQIATALENDLKSFVNEWTSHNAVSYTHLDVYKRQLLHRSR